MLPVARGPGLDRRRLSAARAAAGRKSSSSPDAAHRSHRHPTPNDPPGPWSPSCPARSPRCGRRVLRAARRARPRRLPGAGAAGGSAAPHGRLLGVRGRLVPALEPLWSSRRGAYVSSWQGASGRTNANMLDHPRASGAVRPPRGITPRRAGAPARRGHDPAADGAAGRADQHADGVLGARQRHRRARPHGARLADRRGARPRADGKAAARVVAEDVGTDRRARSTAAPATRCGAIPSCLLNQ